MASRTRESEIERVARAAHERGMSYGKFVSLGLEAPEETRSELQGGEKRCANEECGKIFYSDNPRAKYCCTPCKTRQMWENHKKRREEA